MEPIILQTQKITKRFGKFTANDKIDFDLRKGEIHAIAGENGAGKSTLMKMLYGVYPRTEGDILVDGEVQNEWNPNLARAKGIGMVFQDFRLIPAFTVTENVFVSLRESGYFLNRKELKQKIKEVSDRYALHVNPDAEVWRLDLGQRQHIEIIKLLLQENTRVLIFDEPTSVLAPHEIGAFLEMLSSFRDSGYSIILITHKLHEILAVADRITILRRGEKIRTFLREDGFSRDEIVEEMMGQRVIPPVKEQLSDPSRWPDAKAVSLRDVAVLDNYHRRILEHLNFDIMPGQILGVADISGNGQAELAEAIFGVRKCVAGKITLGDTDITTASPRKRIAKGFRMITEDPLRDNVVPTFTILQNMALVGPKLKFRRGNIDWAALEEELSGRDEIRDLRVPEFSRVSRTLSGGNLQRMSIARAAVSEPKVMIACYPSRGLDVATVNAVHEMLFRLREQGVAIMVISEDLQELMEVSDKLLVLAGGGSMGPFEPGSLTETEIGRMMLKGGADDEITTA